MKSKLLALALGLTVSLSALAGPVVSLPGGPLFVKFTGAEQIAINGANTGYANEISWGVFAVSSMEVGTVVTPNSQISSGGPAFFNNSLGSQVTGIFYGIEQGPASVVPGNVFPGAKGYMDLYWRDSSVLGFTNVGAISLAGPGSIRTTQSTATGFTDGVLLAHIVFTAGIDPNPTITVAGTAIPNAAGFSGFSDFFANVDTSAGGAWATQLDTNYFNTVFGQADLKFKNSYNQLTQWNGGQNILGAKLDDPAQAFAIPEPSVLALMGLAMLGMGMVRRRRND